MSRSAGFEIAERGWEGKDQGYRGYRDVRSCGGGRDTYEQWWRNLKSSGKRGRDNRNGVYGAVHAEPVVEVSVAGMPSILYGNVDEKTGRRIVLEHIVGGKLAFRGAPVFRKKTWPGG